MTQMTDSSIVTQTDPQTDSPADARAREFVLWDPKVQLYLSVAAGVLLLSEYVVGWLPGLDAGGALAWASLAIGMVYGLRAALSALAERRVDIDVLMVVAAGTAAAAGHAGEGALLLVLFTFAGALEQLAMERTKREINGLKAIMPDRAIVLRDATRAVERAPPRARKFANGVPKDATRPGNGHPGLIRSTRATQGSRGARSARGCAER